MATSDVIDHFLRDLDRGLRPLGRRRRVRIVAEARDHLAEAALIHGDTEALARFGAPAQLIEAHISSAAAAAPRRSILAFGLAGLAYGLVQIVASPPTFGLFPPGPWPNDVPPGYLAWKVNLSAALIAMAFFIGLACIAVAWVTRHDPARRQTSVSRLAIAGSLVFAASWPFEATFLIQRGFNVAGSPPAWITSLVCAALLGCHAATLWVSARGLRVTAAHLASG